MLNDVLVMFKTVTNFNFKKKASQLNQLLGSQNNSNQKYFGRQKIKAFKLDH